MTAYVALQELPLDKIVKAAPYDPIYGESLLDLRTGQAVSVRDLLYGLILRSGNDAAYDLALAAAGSEDGFVRADEPARRGARLSPTPTTRTRSASTSRATTRAPSTWRRSTRRLLRDPAFAKIADSREAELDSLEPPRRIDDDQRTAAAWRPG